MAREVLEAAWAAGLGGEHIWIPPSPGRSEDRSTVVTRDLLRRATGRLLRRLDETPRRAFSTWGAIRREASSYGVSAGLVNAAMARAREDLGTWWKQGEEARWDRIRGRADADEAFAAYRRARRAVGHGRMPASIALDILGMAASSIAEAWWERPEESGQVSWQVVEDAVFLGGLRLDGTMTMEIGKVARVIASRHRLPDGSVAEMTARVERGMTRAVEALEEWGRAGD